MALSAGAARRYPSPLRYPGGKAKLANFIKVLMLENELLGTHYVEPYAGGASVALTLLFEEYASSIHINDIDRSVYAFWSAVLHHPEALCRRISRTRITIEQWKRQRDVQAASDPDPLDLAFSTFFLNRTNRSGIIAGAGVIGGQGQTGSWSMDARFDKADLIRRIEKIARFKSRIVLTRRDAAGLLRSIRNRGTSGFIYLDPPYYHKGPTLYANFYTHRDHVQVAEAVRQLKLPWVVSYDATSEVSALYGFARRRRYELDHTAGRHRRGAELVFFADSLKIPRGIRPAHVSRQEVDRRRMSRVLG